MHSNGSVLIVHLVSLAPLVLYKCSHRSSNTYDTPAETNNDTSDGGGESKSSVRHT